MNAIRHWRWWITPMRARTAAALVSVIATVGALLAGGPGIGRATAAALGRCTPTRGTVVAVDFAHWGGPIVRGCGVDQHSGYALLHAAGFTTAGDQHDGPAVICRLGDAAFHHGTQYPTPREDNCILTPPTSGYWAYWVAPAGSDHWAYSPLGAMGDVPKPGEVELWIFGATNVAGTHGSAVPAFSPARLRAHAAAATHATTTATRRTATTTSPAAGATRTTATTPATGTTRTATTATRTSSTSAAPTPRPAPSARRTTHARSHARAHAPRAATAARRGRRRDRHPRPRHAATARTATQTSSTVRAGGQPVVSARPTRQRASAGSATPLIIGGGLAALLCAGAGRAIWLRRRER